MNDFIKSFANYTRSAQFNAVAFWAFPVGTILLIWLLTTVGIKVFSKRKRLKTVFIINRAWIISSMIVAACIIGLICFWWSKNYFSQNPLQLSLLISLIIAMAVPIISLLNVRGYYTQEGLKEIIEQPKTVNQLDETLTLVKGAFRRNKFYLLIPVLGFLFLLLYLNKGTNLITLVYDNSSSMQETTALDALSETFGALDDNNEVVLTTLDGYQPADTISNMKKNMREIMAAHKSANLKGGNVVAFSTPGDAKNGLSQISNKCFGSPICESIWKTFLYLTETKTSDAYANKLLIVMTDGDDNLLGPSLASGKFFFDDESFSSYFPADKVFVIDYSNGASSPFMQRMQTAGVDPYPAENNKEAYLSALDNALQSFKNNWFMIYWTIFIFSLFALVAIFIQPKKIV